MKKVNFKVVLMALSFAFSFLFLGMNSVEAQTGANSALVPAPGAAPAKGGATLTALPSGNFVSPEAAKDRLMVEITSLKGSLAVMGNQSSAPGVAMTRVVRYYQAIHQALVDGGTVPASIVAGLGAFIDLEAVPSNELLAMKNGAIVLLQ